MHKITLLILVFVGLFFPINVNAVDQEWSLKSGFNFISPILQTATEFSSASLLDGNTEITSVFRFDTTTQSFVFQLKLSNNSLFGENFVLQPGLGYILELTSPKTLQISGAAVSVSPLNTLENNFNFIGFSEISSSVYSLFSLYPTIGSLFRWDIDSQEFDFVLRLTSGSTFGEDFALQPGIGYFVNKTASVVPEMGKFLLQGQVFYKSTTDVQTAVAAGVAVNLAGQQAITDQMGFFEILGTQMPVGSQVVSLSHVGKNYYMPISIVDQQQAILLYQIDAKEETIVESHIRIDYSTANQLTASNEIIYQVGNTRSSQGTSIPTLPLDSMGQPAIHSALTQSINSLWSTITVGNYPTNVTPVTDLTTLVVKSDLKLRPISKSFAIVSDQSVLIRGQELQPTLQHIMSDGSILAASGAVERVSSEPLIASFSTDTVTGLAAGTTNLLLRSGTVESPPFALTVIENPATMVKTANLTPVSFTVSLITDQACTMQILYGPENTPTMSSITTSSSRVNTITISGLTSSTLYRYAISLGAPYNTQLKNGAAYFEIATPASGQPVIPTTLAGKVLDGNAQPVQGVVAFVQVDNAWPVLGISDANGIFLVELSNIRLISDGSSVTVTDGTTVSIDVHHATGNKTGITYQLLGGSPYQSGIYTLE